MKIKLIAGLWFVLFSFSAIAAQKSLIFATEATYPPFESIAADGKIQGFDIDVLNAVCQHLRIQCEYVNQPWDSLIPGLKMGKFDAIFGALNITPERLKQIHFSEPYYYPQAAFVVIKDGTNMTNAETTKQKVIGVQGGTTYAAYLAKNYAAHNQIKSYNSIQEALLDLKSGRIDAVFGESPVMQYWLQNNNSDNRYILQSISSHDKDYFGGGVAIGISKNQDELVTSVDQAIEAMRKDGSLEKIQDKYFKKTN